MKITRVRATPVNVPLEAAYVWSYGALPGFTQTIIEVETDEGLTGIGEAPSAVAADVINNTFADALIGRDPIDTTGCELRCLPSSRGVQSVSELALTAIWGGVEMALWDLRGKAWDQPVYQLLGGAVRKDIAFTEYFAYRVAENGKGGEASAEAVADYCTRMQQEHGSTMFEGKVSDADPKDAVALVRAVREVIGDDALLRADSNHAYSVASARMLAPAFEELSIDCWEDPVGTYEDLARLRPHTRLAFSSHNTDFPKAVSLGVPDNIVTNIAGHGGFTATLKFIGACEKMGIGFWCYSGDSGVATAAYMHLCASQSWITKPNQSLLRMQPHDVIEEGPFRPKNNTVRVPEGPGLGVTLSQDKLKFLHRHYLEHGAMNKYHNPADPGRFVRLPLV